MNLLEETHLQIIFYEDVFWGNNIFVVGRMVVYQQKFRPQKNPPPTPGDQPQYFTDLPISLTTVSISCKIPRWLLLGECRSQALLLKHKVVVFDVGCSPSKEMSCQLNVYKLYQFWNVRVTKPRTTRKTYNDGDSYLDISDFDFMYRFKTRSSL